MSKETAQIRNLLIPMNTLSSVVLENASYEKIKLAKQVEECVNEIVSELKVIDETRFTVEEFKKYLKKQDSFGDAFYNLNPMNVKNAQNNWCTDCKFFKTCQRKFDQPEVNGETVACPEYEGK